MVHQLSAVDRNDLATFVGRMRARGLLATLVGLAMGTSASSMGMFRTDLLALINTTRSVALTGLPTTLPELDFVRARLEPSTVPLPVLVLSRGVPTPNFTAVVSAYAIVHATNSPAELLDMLCTGGFWPGLCLRAMIGSARGIGMFPTMPVTYDLLSTPPYSVCIHPFFTSSSDLTVYCRPPRVFRRFSTSSWKKPATASVIATGGPVCLTTAKAEAVKSAFLQPRPLAGFPAPCRLGERRR